MNKKYEILMDNDYTKTVTFCGKTYEVHRIRALKSFNGINCSVKRGDIGGYVQSEKNLSQGGLCWIYGDAIVLQDAIVADDAIIANTAVVRNNAIVGGEARIRDNCRIEDNAIVSENAKIYGNAHIRDKARVFGNAKVHGTSMVYGNSSVGNDAEVFGNARIYGDASIRGDAKVYENAKVGGIVEICDCAEVFGNAIIDGRRIKISENAKIYGDAWIEDDETICEYQEVTTRNNLSETSEVETETYDDAEDDTAEIVYVIKLANERGKVLKLSDKILHFDDKEFAEMICTNFVNDNNIPAVVVPVDKDIILAVNYIKG